MRKLCLKHGTYDELKTCKWVIPEEDVEEAVEQLKKDINFEDDPLISKSFVLMRIKERFGL